MSKQEKYEYERVIQRFTFVVNRIADNNKKIINLNELNKSKELQLVINYLSNENKNLLKLLK